MEETISEGGPFEAQLGGEGRKSKGRKCGGLILGGTLGKTLFLRDRGGGERGKGRGIRLENTMCTKWGGEGHKHFQRPVVGKRWKSEGKRGEKTGRTEKGEGMGLGKAEKKRSASKNGDPTQKKSVKVAGEERIWGQCREGGGVDRERNGKIY